MGLAAPFCLARLAALVIAVVAAGTSLLAADAPPRPKLIVQITIDQLRGDLPLRYQQRFGEGGFRRFLDHGIWYADARHLHSYTETVVGHTTLATATFPSRHGMIANNWFDAGTGTMINNIEDADYPLLPIRDGETLDGGASPQAILTTTFSDELMIATGGHARVYGVSGKDRGAIPLAGHGGKAFWYSDKNGCYVTSTFYYNQYPPWVKSWCDKRLADKFQNKTWTLLHDRSTYIYRDTTNTYPAGTPAEANMEMLIGLKFGRTFPHLLAGGDGFYQALTISPDFDALTAAFAEALLHNEHLGHGTTTDYLAISFSATDYIGHWFSPSSLESEDNLLRLDRTLRELFATIDQEAGLDNTLIVLSGDHGGAEYPETLQTRKINTGRVTEEDIQEAAAEAVTKKYGTDDLILTFSAPYFYIDRDVLGSRSLAEVEQTIADAVKRLPGIHAAVPSLSTGAVLSQTNAAGSDGELLAQIRRNYHEGRSGDVYVAQDPQWQIDGESTPLLLQHDAPWSYDTFVPIAFAGAHLRPEMIHRRVTTVDVAATLAAYAHTNFPSACVGVPLVEVFRTTTK